MEFPRNKYLGLRINSEVKTLIEEKAKKMNVSVGVYVNICILTHMKEHKYLNDIYQVNLKKLIE